MSAHAGLPRGALFVIAAPSGAGKTSLVKAVLARDPSLRVSISHTTRKQRENEVPGRDYNFVGVDEFKRLIAAHEFLEHAQVFDNFYGTSRAQVEALRKAGHNVILEIDWQGARQVKAQFAHAVGIFILPPSIEALEARLRKRGQDSPAVIARRLAAARSEIQHAPEFDFIVINEDFDLALSLLVSIVTATRLRFSTQMVRHRELFTQLGIG
jgi:guanylate kinase